jgi:superfamily II DNA or RNA helicase
MSDALTLIFDGGSLVVRGGEPALIERLPGCRYDPRNQSYRAEARWYRPIVESLRTEQIPYADQARAFEPVTWQWHTTRRPFPHQVEALDAWWNDGNGRGVVVLPTGTGKTFLALMAIRKTQRPTLVVTPTIDLLHQWSAQLHDVFRTEIGLLGGGHYDFQAITVATYDSAYIYLERWGNRFGLLVCDECHHLPGPSYQLIAQGSLAPFRLGLTATPERADGLHQLLDDLLGPVVFRREIHQLAGEFLADYRIERIDVDLTPEEERHYNHHRGIYRGFIAERGIRISGPQGWQRFLQECQRSTRGRQAFRAYLEQKRLERAPEGKMRKLAELLQRHHRDRVLIFTADNATVYRIARTFLVPAITHQTKAKERKQILERFHSGQYSILVTSQVLNEGVDVPAANVGIVLSGSGTTRESVQRLGRLLRKYGDKQAILYEVVTRGTGEEFTSQRRRQHRAFQDDQSFQHDDRANGPG